MRIAYVVTRADAVGGASVHVRDLARGLLDRGWEVRVFLGGEGPVTDQLRAAGVPFHCLRHLRRSIHPLRDLRALGELTQALGEFRPDLVSTHTAKAGWIGRAACARLGLPALYTPHGWAIRDRVSLAHGFVFRQAERVAARWARGIICVSEYERKLAVAARIAPEDRLHTIHNGVHDVGPELRAVPGSKPVRIVSVARLEPPKDPSTLLHALATLRTLDWELDMVGGGPSEPRARRLAVALGVADRIRWLGYQPDPARALAGASVFVLSSRSEGFPRSVLEAMRAGLPVVASDVGGVGEAVSGDYSGLLVAPGNAQALALGLRKLLEDPAIRQRFGSAARQIWERRFRFERMFDDTVALYSLVLKGVAE